MKEININETPDLPGGLKAHLESSREYKKRLFSLHIMYFTVFLMSLAFGISLTGVWPYLHQLDKEAEKEFMGYVVAANPFGQMLFSPLIGMWANRIGSTKVPFIVTLIIFIISSGAYSSLELFTSYRRYWMLTTRLFIGISAANMAICRSYVSAATTLKERTGAVSMLSIAQVLGFIIGPGLQAGVTPLGDKGYPIVEGMLTMNMYTAVGWINVMFGLLNLILLIMFFEEMPIAAKEVMYLSGAKSERAAWKGMKLDYISVWTLIIGFFILTLNFVLLETLGVTLSMDQFAWTTQEALKFLGILLTVGGVFACITTVFIKPICKWFNEVKVLLWGGFLLMFIGRAVYIPWGSTLPVIAYDNSGINSTVNNTLNSTSEPLGCPVYQEWCLYTPAMTITQYLLGFFLTCIGYPLGITLIQTIFSKVLGPRPQGVWMGLMTGSGCLSRVAGPVMVSYLYTRLGTIWTFGSTAIMMLFAMVWLGFVQKRLQLCYMKNTKIDSKFEAQKEEEMIEMNRGDS